MKKIFYLFVLLIFVSCQSGNKNSEPKTDDSAPVELVQTKIEIGGMDCDMCVKSVEKGVNDLAGISSVKVTLDDSTAVIKYNANQVQLAEIEEAIQKRGYSIKATM